MKGEMVKMKKYKLKNVSVDVLRESEGKISTENVFLRDTKMAIMFVEYMLKNINYLKKYEYGTGNYDVLSDELTEMLSGLKSIRRRFKEYQKDGEDS